jgi:hypothetical protein
MKKVSSVIVLVLLFTSLLSWSGVNSNIISEGSQPQISTDSKGIVRVVFGRKDEIYCATSTDNGITFSKPVLVARVPDMHLGMSRGPQLASSANCSVITAMDKSGNIHWYKLGHTSADWKSMGIINDLPGSAPEGLMNIAADNKDNFYAVWLDIRTGKSNQIYFSSLNSKTNHWSKNLLAYRSPDGHVCECCQPHIAVRGTGVAIMFRNWIKGSRDLYIMKSANNGVSFAAPQKLGMDTWKLNGCPMDGGGVIISNTNLINTTWQRQGMIYYCQPGQREVYIGKGRNSSITLQADDPILTFQSNDTIKVVKVKTKEEAVIGNGSFLKSAILPDGKLLYVWEQDNTIKFRKI